jgi:hypothetical protein
MLARAEGMECWMRERKASKERRMLVRARGMECWMREKERPAKENVGKGGGKAEWRPHNSVD